MEHLGLEPHGGRFIRVVLRERESQLERAWPARRRAWGVSAALGHACEGATRAGAGARTALPRCVLRSEDDGVPQHDVALRRRAADAGGRLFLRDSRQRLSNRVPSASSTRRTHLESLEIAHQALASGRRHRGAALEHQTTRGPQRSYNVLCAVERLLLVDEEHQLEEHTGTATIQATPRRSPAWKPLPWRC